MSKVKVVVPVALAAFGAGVLLASGLWPAQAGSHHVDTKATISSKAAAEFGDRDPGPNASIGFAGPFDEDDALEWPPEVKRLMSCLKDEGLDEMPQSHAEVVALWNEHHGGEHYVWRDNAVKFELSDSAVRSAYEACR